MQTQNHTPIDSRTPTIEEGIRTTHRALRARVEELRGRTELKTHLGMKQLEEHMQRLEGRVDRMKAEVGAWSDEALREIREDIDLVSAKVEELRSRIDR